MLKHILTLTALLSILSLGLVADEVPSIPTTQELEEQTQEENSLTCGCKKKKTNSHKTDRELACKSTENDKKPV